MEPCLEGYKRTYRDVSRLEIERLLREGEEEGDKGPQCSFDEEGLGPDFGIDDWLQMQHEREEGQ